MVKNLQTKQIANEVLWIVVGCILYSLSVVWFLDPAQIIPGSVTGIAVVKSAVWHSNWCSESGDQYPVGFDRRVLSG